MVSLRDVADEVPEDPRRLADRHRGLGDIDSVVAEVRHPELTEQESAVRVRVRAHAPVALRGELAELGEKPAVLVEELLRPVALEPVLEQRDVLRVRRQVGEGNLVRAPVVLGLLPVDLARARPALRRTKDDHRPLRPRRRPVLPCLALQRPDLRDHRLDGLGHLPMQRLRVRPLDEVRLVPVADQQRLQLVQRDAGQHGRVRDLVAVQVEDVEDRAVVDRVQELVGMPGGGQRPGLGLAVADDARNDQVRVVERGPVGVRDRIAELSTLVDRPGRLRCRVAGNSIRKRELLEQLLHPLGVLGDVRIELAVGPLEVGMSNQTGPAVTGPCDQHHVQRLFFDDAVQMHVDEVEAGCRSPMPKQARLDVLQLQRLSQERVVIQIDLASREIVGGAPVCIQLFQNRWR